jgi:methylmalonyl-CoA mutase N-terminal domain/subunit
LISQIKEGKLVLVGVNKFQNKSEVVTDVIKESISKINAKTLINPIHSINLSQFIQFN